MDAPKCSNCGVVMVEGWMLELGHRNLKWQESWIEGPPEKGRWFGWLKTDGKKKYAVTAFRCSVCGKLEFYATHRAYF